MKSSLVNDKEVFDRFRANESLRRLRVSFDFLLGHPIWWISFKLNGSQQKWAQSLKNSLEIWNDPRLRDRRFAAPLFNAIRRHSKEVKPFLCQAPRGTAHFCIPLATPQGRVVGYLGLSALRKGLRPEVLNLLTSQVQLILENCAKSDELERLSATIRPRAIALSTVHTVHRIINSTLNLDELISRLAHLTAQVLRSNRCAIYLVDRLKNEGLNGSREGHNGSRPKSLVCKAVVGYPKHFDRSKKIPLGSGVEGGVLKSAQIVLRKTMICIPLIDEDVIGVMHVSLKKDKNGFTYFDQEILTTLAEEAVIAIKNAQLYEEQKKVTLGTIQSLAVILGTRVPTLMAPDLFLRLALRVAEELRLNEEETQALHYATLLKDTAKIGIPDDILKKPSKLTGEEYQIIKDHPIKGAKIVESFESLRQVVPVILHLREKFDGTGYPKGLKGDKIPIGSRILAVVSAFEAILMGRPYRDKSSLQEALDEILRNSGSQFDPKVVEAFIRVMQREKTAGFLKNAS